MLDMKAGARKTVCLIGALHLSMNPRLVKEADALSEAGYQVIVIAPKYGSGGIKSGDVEIMARSLSDSLPCA